MKTYKKPNAILVSLDLSEMIAYSNVTGKEEGLGGIGQGSEGLDTEGGDFFGNSKGSSWDED